MTKLLLDDEENVHQFINVMVRFCFVFFFFVLSNILMYVLISHKFTNFTATNFSKAQASFWHFSSCSDFIGLVFHLELLFPAVLLRLGSCSACDFCDSGHLAVVFLDGFCFALV